MGRRHRWFAGIVAMACLVAIVIELVPIAQVPVSATSVSATQDTVQSIKQSSLTDPSTELLSEANGSEVNGEAPSPTSIFLDPNQQYEVALLSGFKSYTVANQSILESADGSMAYSVTVVPTLTEAGGTLTKAALAQVAQVAFQQGEGFITKQFQSLPQGGIKIDWAGQVTTRASQPLSGTIFAQQSGDKVFLLMIAATESGQAELENAIAILPSSLRPL